MEFRVLSRCSVLLSLMPRQLFLVETTERFIIISFICKRKETSHGINDLLALNKHVREIIVSVNKAEIKEWKA